MKPRFLILAGVTAALAVGVGWGVGAWRRMAEQSALAIARAERGQFLYHAHCASCHGADGHGDGASAATLRPPPRDFAARPWRFEPARESIAKVILDGIPGTAMASARHAFTSTDVDVLANHVLQLASLAPVPIERTALGDAIQSAGFVDMRGTSAPSLSLSDAKGKSVRLSQLKGRLVLINFWGVNCVHCLKELPGLCQLEQELAPRGLTVLHVCADADDATTAQECANQHAPQVRALADDTALAVAHFEVQSLPTFWLIGPDGAPIARATGARDWRANAPRRLLDECLPAQ